MPSAWGTRFPTIKCWPYRIEIFQRHDFMGYEMRVSLTTRNREGQEHVLMTRRTISDFDITHGEAFTDILRHMVEASIMELTRAHTEEHLRFEL